ncbi:hypothetical protein E2C01_073689 [Portunus trituberculatus]|uniref:Uncharacterized protein n=1 Tax=Portunus trituberculatus TaxID=210409 RepID=A0A5B7IAD9_PORTR|nr:hypothetical protein [Portunus trituberculatus]
MVLGAPAAGGAAGPSMIPPRHVACGLQIRYLGLTISSASRSLLLSSAILQRVGSLPDNVSRLCTPWEKMKSETEDSWEAFQDPAAARCRHLVTGHGCLRDTTTCRCLVFHRQEVRFPCRDSEVMSPMTVIMTRTHVVFFLSSHLPTVN